MKTLDIATSGTAAPSLFQIAAFFEDFFPGNGFKQASAAVVRQLPFGDLMVNPEKLMNVLRSRTLEDSSVGSGSAQTQVPGKRSIRPTPKRQARQASTKNGTAVSLSRKIEFTLEAPWAGSVKLAGDFTEWDLGSIEMMRSHDGFWFTAVPLAPGCYSYRFIVDGEWYDDPTASQRVPNPFGSHNGVIHVP